MNKKNVSEALNQINETYVAEAIPGEEGLNMNKKRQKRMAVAAGIAALLIIPASIHFIGQKQPIVTNSGEQGPDTDGNNTQIANPYQEVADLVQLNGLAKTQIRECSLQGVSDSTYTYIDGTTPVAQYEFTYQTVLFTVRAAKTTEDISGIYVGDGTIGELAKEDGEIVSADGYTFVRYYEGNVQYVLMAIDAEEDLFRQVCGSLRG